MNAVFIHIPKTAGEYVIRVLGLQNLISASRARNFEQKGLVTFQHQDYPKLVKRGIVGKEFDNTAFKFTFCRNPFDRAVSHYFYTRKIHPDILPEEVTFLEFTRNLGIIAPIKRKKKMVFRTQRACMFGMEMHFTGRFEHLNRDLVTISEILGIDPKPSPKINSTRHKPFQEYYDNESEDNVRKFYKEDFKYFGYDDTIPY